MYELSQTVYDLINSLWKDK